MVNCNPETVSTDYDTSDRLYFEPLTAEDVLEIMAVEGSRGTLQGHHRAVRRPDAAEAGAEPGEGRHPHPRHLRRLDRPRRGPRPLQAPARQARPAPAQERHRLFRGAGAPGGRRPRPAAGGAPLQRARRPRHGDPARRGGARALPARHAAGAGALGRQGALPQRQNGADQHGARHQPAAVRPLSLRRGGGRRRRALRRHGRVHLRHHGAHRGGRHPFRRQRLLPAAALALARHDRPAGGARRAAWRWRSTSAA